MYTMAFVGRLLQPLGQIVLGAVSNGWHLFEFSIVTFSALINFFRFQGFRGALYQSANHLVVCAGGDDDFSGIGEGLGDADDASLSLVDIRQADRAHGVHVFLHHLAGAL